MGACVGQESPPTGKKVLGTAGSKIDLQLRGEVMVPFNSLEQPPFPSFLLVRSRHGR